MTLALTAWRLLLSHFRIGYVSGLLWLDCLVGAVVTFDILTYRLIENLSLATPFRLAPKAPWLGGSAPGLITATVFLVMIPILVAVLRVALGAGVKPRTPFGDRGWIISCVHISFSLFFGYFTGVALVMENTAGFELIAPRVSMSPVFSSFFLGSIGNIAFPTVAGGLLLSLLSRTGYALLHERKKVAEIVKEYDARVRLADLASGLHPTHGRHSINFNSAALAPEIRSVKRATERSLAAYQSVLPSSAKGAAMLQRVVEETRELLHEVVNVPPAQDGYIIEFFSSTSRAIDAALCRIRGLKTLVVSPYEHPIERTVGRWQEHTRNLRLETLIFGGEDFHKPARAQETKFLSQMQKTSLDPPSALLLSEVSYATGNVLPIRSLIKNLRDRHGSRLTIIVDGAHAVGNGRLITADADWDAYAFGAHKWLLSYEPLGVLVSRTETTSAFPCYDTPSDRGDFCTVSMHSLLAFNSSLKMLRGVGLMQLWSRSTDLKNRLVQEVAERFEVVGKHGAFGESLMVALRPRKEYRWRYSADDLRSHFADKGFNVYFVEIETVPWVRLAFPYFLDAPDVRRLSKRLLRATVSK